MRRRDVQLRVYVEVPVPELTISYETVELQTDWECCICLESESSEYIFQLTCGHMIHESCAMRWFNESLTCPLCRTGI